MSRFEELLAQLAAEEQEQSTMAKAMPAEDGEDDKAIQAAAEEGAEAEEENPEDESEEEESEEEEAPMTKSIQIDGEDVQVVDAEELIKSLSGLTTRVDKHESALTKGLEHLLGAVKSQGDLIKSMQGEISKLRGKGTGRKTVLTVHEKSNAGEELAKSQQEGQLSGAEFMAKSNSAFDAGKISGIELTTIDVSLRNNEQIAPGLIAKVLS